MRAKDVTSFGKLKLLVTGGYREKIERFGTPRV
jgi:hypothetical protein